jgi:hypothetical protein
MLRQKSFRCEQLGVEEKADAIYLVGFYEIDEEAGIRSQFI